MSLFNVCSSRKGCANSFTVCQKFILSLNPWNFIFSYCHEVITLNLLNLSDCHFNSPRTLSSLEVLSLWYTVSYLYHWKAICKFQVAEACIYFTHQSSLWNILKSWYVVCRWDIKPRVGKKKCQSHCTFRVCLVLGVLLPLWSILEYKFSDEMWGNSICSFADGSGDFFFP